jgi:preprotein translocase subunit SecA
MISGLLKKIFGSRNDRLIKQYKLVVRKINALEAGISALSDDDLRNKTAEFRLRVANGETLDAVLPEAFAVVREASKRTLGMRHFDVQLIGEWSCTTEKSPKCAPVKERRWSPRCPRISTRWPETVCTSSP